MTVREREKGVRDVIHHSHIQGTAFAQRLARRAVAGLTSSLSSQHLSFLRKRGIRIPSYSMRSYGNKPSIICHFSEAYGSSKLELGCSDFHVILSYIARSWQGCLAAVSHSRG